MIRKRAKPPIQPPRTSWLLTFSDMMTLLLTFFVLLFSQSVLDEGRQRKVLGSMSETFGQPVAPSLPKTRAPSPTASATDQKPPEDLKAARNYLPDYFKDKVNYQANGRMQIISLSDHVLFSPGRSELGEDGRKLLNSLLPVFLNLKYPILLSGHASTPRDEFINPGQSLFTPEPGAEDTWGLSLHRVQAVYRYLLSRGMDPHMAHIEAHGRYSPRFEQTSPEGRKFNRRIDIVLDTRDQDALRVLQSSPSSRSDADAHFLFKGFKFDL